DTGGPFKPVLADIRDVQKGRAIQPDGYEGALHARQHPGHLAQIHIADESLVCAALEMQLLQRTLFDDGDTGLERGYVDENIFCHGSSMPAWRNNWAVSNTGRPITPV